MINILATILLLVFSAANFQNKKVVDETGTINPELVEIFSETGISIPAKNTALLEFLKENGMRFPTYSAEDFGKIKFLFLEEGLSPKLLEKANVKLMQFYEMPEQTSDDKFLPYNNANFSEENLEENLNDVSFITLGTSMYDSLLERFVTLHNFGIFQECKKNKPQIYFLAIPELTINEARLGSPEQFIKSCTIAYKKLKMPEEIKNAFIKSLESKKDLIAQDFKNRKNINFEKIGKKELTQVDGLEIILNHTYFNIFKDYIEIFDKNDYSQKDLKNYSVLLKEKKQEAIESNTILSFIDLTTPFAIRHERIEKLNICNQENLQLMGSIISSLNFDKNASSEEYRDEEMEFRNLTSIDKIIKMLIKTFRFALSLIVE